MGNEEKKYENWGLSLSLRPPITHQNHQNKSVYKRYHEVLCPIEKQSQKMQKFNTEPMLRPSTTAGLELDVKPTVPMPPLVMDLEDVEIPKQSSPSPESTLTSTGIGKGLCGDFDGERHFANDEEEAAATCGGGNGGGGERKKLRLTKEQIMVLEQAFREYSTVNTKQKLALARQVNLNPRQVEVWFQNRRARIKLKHREAECEQLRRLCERLKEEKRKLQKEVQELKDLQAISPDHESMSMSIIHANSHQVPNPTTLNLCHSCKSVFISTSSSLSKEMQKSQKLALDIFPRLRPDPLNIKKLSTSSAVVIRQYESD